MQDGSKNALRFDRFEIDLDRRRLVRDGEAVALKSKTFDVLLALIESGGQLLSKDDLFRRVWADQVVEENNLTVHIAALRKALGEVRGHHRFIVTVPGKGYRFVGELLTDQPSELVVESHKIQRITIREEIEDSVEPQHTLARAPEVTVARRSSTRSRVRPWYAIGAGAILVLLVGVAVLLPGLPGSNSRAQFPFAKMSFKRLTHNGRVSLAALSDDGKRFAYVTNDRGRRSLKIGEVSGGNDIELRPAAEEEYFDLEFAKDGSGLFYSSRDSRESASALFRIPLLGGPAEKIQENVRAFELSPDSGWVALADLNSAAGHAVIKKMPLAGGVITDLASIKGKIFENTLSWSSDGSRLAVVGETEVEKFNEIIVVSANGGETKRVRYPELQEITGVSWLNDDSGLIVIALETRSWAAVPQNRLFYLDLNSSAAKNITDDLSSYVSSLQIAGTPSRLLTIESRQINNVWIAPAEDLGASKAITNSSFGRYEGLWGLGWTPDGKLIYTTSGPRSVAIARMNADGSGQQTLTTPGSVDSALEVSPDGSFVVFHSNRSGGFDIWRMNSDGSDARQLTFTKASYQPFISPDGAWIYYKGIDGERSGLRRVPSNGGTPEVINESGTSWGRFSPDGKFFAGSYFEGKYKLGLYSAADHSLLKKFEFPKTATSFVGIGWMPDGRSIMYRDKESGYWVQSIDGGEPTKLASMPDELLYNFSWSTDGRYLAFVRGQHFQDVVVLTAE